MNGLPILNMTSFFNRELFLYSLGDISLSKPVSLKKAGFLFLGIALWSIPIVLIFGFYFNLFYLALLLSVPVLIASIGDKPLFDGRGLIDAIRVTFRYIFSEKCYTDFTVTDIHKKPEYFVQKEIWISRRRELMELAELWEKKSR